MFPLKRVSCSLVQAVNTFLIRPFISFTKISSPGWNVIVFYCQQCVHTFIHILKYVFIRFSDTHKHNTLLVAHIVHTRSVSKAVVLSNVLMPSEMLFNWELLLLNMDSTWGLLLWISHAYEILIFGTQARMCLFHWASDFLRWMNCLVSEEK